MPPSVTSSPFSNFNSPGPVISQPALLRPSNKLRHGFMEEELPSGAPCWQETPLPPSSIASARPLAEVNRFLRERMAPNLIRSCSRALRSPRLRRELDLVDVNPLAEVDHVDDVVPGDIGLGVDRDGRSRLFLARTVVLPFLEPRKQILVG